jgi:uncharacterized protein
MLENEKIIKIISRKFNKKIHKTWRAKLIETNNSLFCLVGEFENEINHPHLGVIRRGTISYEFFWLERWYNVFRFHEPDGSLRNYYCNISMPPKFENLTLDFIDLDIDILIWKDFSFEILDLEEFEINALDYSYSNYLREKIQMSLSELLYMLELRLFPFDYRI